MPSEQEWYYSVGGFEMGPVTFEDLIAITQAQQIAADDQVKTGVHGKWRKVGSIGRLMAVLPFEKTRIDVARTPNGHRIDAVSPVPAHLAKVTGPTTEIQAVTTSAAINTVSASPHSTTVPQSSLKPHNDESILREIRTALASRNLAGLNQLEFRVDTGIVTVLGTTSSEGERLLVKHLIRRISGVARVVDSTTNAADRSVVMAPTSKASIRTGYLGIMIGHLWGLKTIHAVSLTASVGLSGLGYWYFGTNPARPVAVHPVRGKVIMNGEPLANASIVLHRVGKSKLPINLHPRAQASEDGTFALETFDRADGAPNGEFIATVFLRTLEDVNGEKLPGQNTLPVVYSRPETSPLKIQITSSTSELKPLELSLK